MSFPLFFAKLLIRTGIAPWLPGVRRRVGGGGAFLRYYADPVLTAPFDDLQHLADALRVQDADVIDLTAGSPAFDLLSSASTKLPVDRRGWPSVTGLPELRQAVAEKLLIDNRLAFHPAEDILITAGALGAAHTILDAFVNRRDRVVLFDPCSPMYPLALRGRRARIRWIPSWVEEGRTRFRLDHLANTLRGARLLVVNSPANPTGGIMDPEDLEQIAFWAERRDVLILSDEVLERFHHETVPVSIGTLAKAQRRTLTIGSVSKSHALASARVGWIAAHRHLLRPCLVSHALRTPLIPTLSQQLAHTALRTKSETFTPIRAQFSSWRHYTSARLRGMGLEPAWPAGAFFQWIPVHELGFTGQEFASKLLNEKRVRLTPGHLFGPSGAGYVRLSYAADEGRLHEGLNRLAEYLRTLPGNETTASKETAEIAA